MNFEVIINAVRKELSKPLPGEHQQYLMSPEFRGRLPHSNEKRKAAVMICLFPKEDELQTVFIKRPDYNGPHGGQVSFPGGVYEEVDRDLIATAIRETEEEIGLRIFAEDILGLLTPLSIPVSNMIVQPVVGYTRNYPEFKTDEREVEYLIPSGLPNLLNPEAVEREKWILHGTETEVPFYRVNGNIIWGATAMILSEFLAVISNSGQFPHHPYSGSGRSGK
ncbi:MAG: CoA pyrophosphatase [Bacteroidales bacterium]|nr:CoA pyrophosphatase [Bacteroidales bacterium]MCB9012967.1 CoA pyrophosphatase [Bacteroidales bacterium]